MRERKREREVKRERNSKTVHNDNLGLKMDNKGEKGKNEEEREGGRKLGNEGGKEDKERGR